MTDEPIVSYTPDSREPVAISPAEPQASTPPILLPEHTVSSRSSVQFLAGASTLVLLFFASASITVAYLGGAQLPLSSSQQTASAITAEDPFAAVSLIGQAAYVLDLTTNKVLYTKNPDTQLPLASLTKVALVLAISEVLKPAMEVTIPVHTPPDGAGIRLPAGLRFPARDLIDFTLVASSNEGADILTTVAEAGIRAAYPQATPNAAVLWRMNNIAQNLGLTHMVFHNSSGLDLDPTRAGAYGSAHDVAALFGYAASTAPSAFGQTSRDTVTIRAITGETVTGVNTDEALPAIPGLVMGKTGFTELAGGNLAVVFEVGPARPVVAVILNSTKDGRFEDMKKLVAATIAAIGAGQ